MKKIFSFAIMLVAAALVSCGGNTTKPSASQEAAAGTVQSAAEQTCCEKCDSTECRKCDAACEKAEGECCKK